MKTCFFLKAVATLCLSGLTTWSYAGCKPFAAVFSVDPSGREISSTISDRFEQQKGEGFRVGCLWQNTWFGRVGLDYFRQTSAWQDESFFSHPTTVGVTGSALPVRVNGAVSERFDVMEHGIGITAHNPIAPDWPLFLVSHLGYGRAETSYSMNTAQGTVSSFQESKDFTTYSVGVGLGWKHVSILFEQGNLATSVSAYVTF